MRKITFFLMFVLFASVLKANDEVMLTMTAEPGKTLDFSIYFADSLQTLNVDWGDGQLKEYTNIASSEVDWWPTDISGTVSGDGTVTLYAAPGQLTSFETLGSVSGSKISAIDLSKVTNLTSLTLSSHALTSVDVSGLTQLTTLYLNNNQLTSVDLSKNTLVTTLHIEGNQLASADLSAQTKVSTLYLSDNSTLSEIVWPSGNSSLKNVYVLNLVGMTGTLDLSAYPSLSYVSANGSHYTSIDVRGSIPASLFCMNSQVSAIYADSVKTTLNCTGSRMTPGTLPQLSPKNYLYAPLAAYELSEDIKAGEALDLSGLVSAADEATYTWKYAKGTPVPADSYKVEAGVTTFTTALDSAVYCEITSTLFPKLSGDNAYKTTLVNVVSGETPAREVMLTMTAEPGKTLDFSIYFADSLQTLNVDWGDGQLKEYTNIASSEVDWWPTDISGTVSGDGTVTLYAAPGQLTSFETLGSVSGSKISAIDLSKVTNLTSLTLSSHALTSVDVSGLTQLTTLYLNNNQLTSVDLSKNTLVTTLHLEGNQLASVDLSAQTKVSTLYLSDNSTLSEIVWPSGNSSLKNVYVLNLVGMTGTLDLSAYPSLSYVSANGSHYTSIDVRGSIPASLFCMNSQVSAIYADSVKTTLNCTGSRMTPGTLPQLSPKNYLYAPLAAYELSEDIKAGEALDLSGLVSAGDEATYTWKYAKGTPVPADSYSVEAGVTTFTTALDSAVYCEITSTLFPKLSGDNAYKTTTVNVVSGETPAPEVMLTMTAEPGKTLDFSIYFADSLQTLNVDWGDGQLKEYTNIASSEVDWWPTDISGTVSGDGTVTLYAAPGQLTSFEAMGSVSGSKISAIDLSKVTNLTSLTLSSHALTSVDVSGLTQLTTLYLNNNQLTSVDLSKNTLVTTLHLEGNQLTSVDLSAQTKVSTLYLSDNSPLSEIVWPSGNSSLKNVYALNLVGMTGTLDLSAYPSLSYVSANGSHYTSIDVRGSIPASLFCMNSQVSAIYADSVKTTLNCTGSRMTPATLPQLSPKNYLYAPLAAYELSEDIKAGEALDLSGLVSAGDEATYTWKYAKGTPVPADSYTVESGVTTFTTALDSAVYCEITSTLFPKLSGDNAYKTTEIKVLATSTSIDETEASAEIRFYALSGRIVVENVAAGTPVAVYSLSGVKCAEVVSAEGKAALEVPQGYYIVVAGTTARQVIVP